MFIKERSSYEGHRAMTPPEDGSSPISTLPTELVSEILKYSTVQDIGNASLVSKEWHHASESEVLWEDRCRKSGSASTRDQETWKDVAKREHELFTKGKILDYEASEIELSPEEQEDVRLQLKTHLIQPRKSCHEPLSKGECSIITTFDYLGQKAQVRLWVEKHPIFQQPLPNYLVRIVGQDGLERAEFSYDIQNAPVVIGVKGNVFAKLSILGNSWKLDLHDILHKEGRTFHFDSFNLDELMAFQTSSSGDTKLEWIDTTLYLSMHGDKGSIFRAFEFTPDVSFEKEVELNLPTIPAESSHETSSAPSLLASGTPAMSSNLPSGPAIAPSRNRQAARGPAIPPSGRARGKSVGKLW